LTELFENKKVHVFGTQCTLLPTYTLVSS